MLVVDGHALKPVNLLHLVHQVILQCLRTANLKNLVWIDRALGQLLAFLQQVPLEHDDMFADRDEMLLLLAGLHVANDDRAFAANRRTKVHNTIDLGNLRAVLRYASLEQLCNTRQTTGDVLGLGRLSGRLGDQASGDNGVSLFNDNVSPGGNRIIGDGLTLRVLDDHLGMQILLVIDDN